MTRRIVHTVAVGQAGWRLDRLLVSLGLSAGQRACVKRREAATVAGAPIHANRVLREGEQVALDMQLEGLRPGVPPGVAIRYEDEDLWIVDKPAPLPVQSGSQRDGASLEALFCRYMEAGFVFRPVNRLDKGTSGLMVVAKHAYIQGLLQRLLHTGAFTRAYVAAVMGGPPAPSGVVALAIGKGEGVLRRVDPQGRPTLTRYALLKKGRAASLVALELGTGRTHQLRVHMQALGCPILGDAHYGAADPRLPGRFALHSRYLALRQPITGQWVQALSPPPEGWRALLG